MRGNRQSSARRFTLPVRRKMSLSNPGLVAAGAQFSAENGLVEVDFTVPDLEIESAVRISTYPRLVANCRTLASEVRQRNEVALVTLQALREWRVLQRNPPPTPNLGKVYISLCVVANYIRSYSLVHPREAMGRRDTRL